MLGMEIPALRDRKVALGMKELQVHRFHIRSDQ